MQDDEKRYAEWAKKMAGIAIEIANWHSKDNMLSEDIASDAVEHLLLAERRFPRLNLMENESYSRRVLQNKIRDGLTAEQRRSKHVQRFSDEIAPGDDHAREHEIHSALDMPFEDENLLLFEESEELFDVYKRLCEKLSPKPRRLLESIQQLDTLDHEVLAKATDIRSVDSVRATLSNIQRTAKNLI